MNKVESKNITLSQNELNAKREYKEGLVSIIVCQLWWGIMPIYWHMLRPIGSDVIIFYRILTVALVCAAIAIVKYPKDVLLEPFRDKKMLIKYIVAGFMVSLNWSLYIWAVNANFVIQTCIGYYIEPVMICLCGTIVFKEKMGKLKGIALLFAGIAVAYILIYYHEFPGIALGLACSFSIYAAIKKDMKKPPMVSLLYETVFFAPFALVIIVYMELTGNGALSAVGSAGTGEMYKYFLMLLCGAFTAFPLGLYANANNKVNMFLLGVSAYLSTSIALVLGIWLFKEPFDIGQLIAFIFIWIGVVFFTIGEFKSYKEMVKNAA